MLYNYFYVITYYIKVISNPPYSNHNSHCFNVKIEFQNLLVPAYRTQCVEEKTQRVLPLS